MKPITSLLTSLPAVLHPLLLGGLLLAPLHSRADTQDPLVDDFSNETHMTSGIPRMIITDKDAGGGSVSTQTFADGTSTVTGTLKPGRGMPGFVSLPLVLAPDSGPRDLSAYVGVRLIVHVKQGSLSVQVSSTDVTNFDYHTSPAIARDSEGLKEVRIPFAAMKRVWSEPTALNLSQVTSINLVSAGMAPGAFAYTIDEIGFY